MEPTLAEVRLFAGNFAPRGWAFCDGQLLPINQNQALFSLLGTIYGGDGRTTFGLPDLRGRVPLGPRNGPGLSSYREGQRGGVESVSLTNAELPSHRHGVAMGLTLTRPASTTPSDSTLPIASAVPGATSMPAYSNAGANTQMLAGPIAGGVTLQASGGGQPHENRQPLLGLNYIIALQGLFPSRS